MSPSLTQQLLESHRLQARRGSPARDTEEWDLRVDHVAFDQSVGPLVFAALAPLGVERIRTEVALLCLGRAGIHPGLEHSDDSRRLARTARRLGAHVSRSGRGRCDAVYRERFAAPGRLVLAAGEGTPSSGAFGVLALSAGELEAAVTLAGHPLHAWLARPVVIGVSGGLASWVSGSDLALEIERRLPRARPPWPILEIGGQGVAELTMADRVAVASRCAGRRATAVLFPSDEITRATLRAHGREADWKPLEGERGATTRAEIEIELDSIEPMIAPFDDSHGARTVRHAMGLEVRRVVLGTQSTCADLARVADVLNGRQVAPLVELTIVPGSRAILETATQSGLLRILLEAGARLVEGEIPAGPESAATLPGSGLCFGVVPRGLPTRRTAWHQASPETCAASALTGRLSDPRELDLKFRRNHDVEPVATTERLILRPAQAGETVEEGFESLANESPREAAGLTPGQRLERPLRGTVLIELDDRVDAARILSTGARLDPVLSDLAGLAAHAFESIDAGFAERARRHRSGFVVAGSDFGLGSAREQEALVLVELGVRAVLARSFDPEFKQRLVRAGVLPLRLRLESDQREIHAGDELEIPGLPDNLERAKPLVVRNLTRGTQLTLPHDLDPYEIGLVRAGGLLALARDEIVH